MGADQRELPVARRARKHLRHRGVQALRRVLRRVEPGRVGALGDPGRMLEHVAEQLDEKIARLIVLGFRSAGRWWRIQCRATSMRRATQTRSCAAT